MMRSVLLGAAAAAAVMPAAASAQSVMSTVWSIEPTPQLAGTVWQGKGGQIVWKQRLLPSGLVEIDGDFADPNDKDVSVTAHTQAFEVQHPDALVFCATTRREGGKAQQFLAWSLPKQLCFVDRDRDGRFDGYFRPKSSVAGLPIITGMLPDRLKPVLSLAYSRIPVDRISRPYWIGLEYLGRPLGLPPSFTIEFGSEAARDHLTQPIRLLGSTWPREATVLGSHLTLFEAVDGVAKVVIDQPMSAQPFSVLTRDVMMFR